MAGEVDNSSVADATGSVNPQADYEQKNATYENLLAEWRKLPEAGRTAEKARAIAAAKEAASSAAAALKRHNADTEEFNRATKDAEQKAVKAARRVSSLKMAYTPDPVAIEQAEAALTEANTARDSLASGGQAGFVQKRDEAKKAEEDAAATAEEPAAEEPAAGPGDLKTQALAGLLSGTKLEPGHNEAMEMSGEQAQRAAMQKEAGAAYQGQADRNVEAVAGEWTAAAANAASNAAARAGRAGKGGAGAAMARMEAATAAAEGAAAQNLQSAQQRSDTMRGKALAAKTAGSETQVKSAQTVQEQKERQHTFGREEKRQGQLDRLYDLGNKNLGAGPTSDEMNTAPTNVTENPQVINQQDGRTAAAVEGTSPTGQDTGKTAAAAATEDPQTTAQQTTQAAAQQPAGPASPVNTDEGWDAARQRSIEQQRSAVSMQTGKGTADNTANAASGATGQVRDWQDMKEAGERTNPNHFTWQQLMKPVTDNVGRWQGANGDQTITDRGGVRIPANRVTLAIAKIPQNESNEALLKELAGMTGSNQGAEAIDALRKAGIEVR
jgi:hypothetical protein